MYHNLYARVFIMSTTAFLARQTIHIFNYALKNFYKLYYDLVLASINFAA